jgi:hypothetical protein
VLREVPRQSLERLRRITRDTSATGDEDERTEFVAWINNAIARRNVAGLADPSRRNLYPVDLDVLIERHALLGMSREQLLENLPALRGKAPQPLFGEDLRDLPAFPTTRVW